MSDITKISILGNGDQETVDTIDKNLVVDSVTVGGVGGTTLTKTVLDSLIAGGGSSTQTVDKFILNSTDESNKFITLSGTPLIPSNTILLVDGATNLYYSDDFQVIGNQLSWSGLGLDGILANGDKLTITYGT